MSATVVYPDFSANRSVGASQTFACTMALGEGHLPWVHVAGDLNVNSASRLVQALRVIRSTPGMVVLDLRDLTSMDAFGAQVIMLASAHARRAKRRLIVISA